MDSLLNAINFATNKHNGQKRKDGKTPYISHVLGVALIISQITKDEDVLLAGVLHDVLEDTDTTDEELIRLFGLNVHKIVKEVTEEDTTMDWKSRKEISLKKIPTLSDSAALIKTADILYNLHGDWVSNQKEGAGFYKIFEESGKEKIAYDRVRLELFKKYHKNIVLLGDMEKYLSYIENLNYANIRA